MTAARCLRSAASTFVALALLAAASSAHAQPATNATKDAARKIAEEGLELYDSAKYEAALDRFLRADALVHAPTMQLMAARALEKLGRLVEALGRYAAARNMVVAPDASYAFRAAVADATEEHDALVARIPQITVTVNAPEGAAVTLSVDGAVVPAEKLGHAQPVDPGAHTLRAAAGAAVKESRIELKEGERRSVHFDLGGASPSPLRTAGWVGVGLGAAGVVLGAVTAGLALGEKSKLDVNPLCGNNECPAGTPGVSELNALRDVSTAGFVAGGILLAGGFALVIFAPKRAPAATATVQWSPRIGVGSVGLQGAF